jgi:hypothetical protein
MINCCPSLGLTWSAFTKCSPAVNNEVDWTEMQLRDEHRASLRPLLSKGLGLYLQRTSYILVILSVLVEKEARVLFARVLRRTFAQIYNVVVPLSYQYVYIVCLAVLV